jgi:hypothetical protein
MRRLAAALLLSAGAAHGDGPMPLDTSAVQALDYATLTPPEARRLDGKEALFRVVLYTNPVMLTHFALAFFRGSSMDLTLPRTVWK